MKYIAILYFIALLISCSWASTGYVKNNEFVHAPWVEGYFYSETDDTPLGFNSAKSKAGFEDDDTYIVQFDYTLPERISDVPHLFDPPLYMHRQIGYELNAFSTVIELEEFNVMRPALEAVHIKLQNVALDLNTIYTCHLNASACPVGTNTSIIPTVIFDFDECSVCTDDPDDDIDHCALWHYTQDSFDLANIQSVAKCYMANSTVPAPCFEANCVWLDMARMQVITYEDVLRYAHCVENIVSYPRMERTISLLERYYFNESNPFGSISMEALASEIHRLEIHEHMVDDDDETYGIYDYEYRPCYNASTRGVLLDTCPQKAVDKGLWCANPWDDDEDCMPTIRGSFGDNDHYYTDDDCENDAHVKSIGACLNIVEMLDRLSRTLVRRMGVIGEHLIHSRLYDPARYTFGSGLNIFPDTSLFLGELDGVA